MSEVSETVKREAVLAVLSRLGNDNLAMLKYNLATSYKIDLEHDDASTLEELQIALGRLLGVNGASLIIREIHNEMKMLAMK